MLSEAWIDPRSVDWTDGLNPLRVPGWSRNNSPYAYQALQDPFMQALRIAGGIENRIYVAPEPAAQLVTPGATVDFEVPSEPNFWLYAVAASNQGDDEDLQDFLFNVTDSETGATLFSQPVSMTTMNPQRNGTADRSPYYLLSTPHLFASPSYPVVRMINTSADSQIIRVTLFGCVEYDRRTL